eukprot:COSAG02_NODE_3405_length_6797_cov_2.630188_4_plen_187_part_00
MLGENFESEYSCCQLEAVGYQPCCYSCCSCWKSCPMLALCTEAWCCTGLSLSFTRIHAMQKFNVRPDPMDYTCIRFSNCMQCLSCICYVAAILDDNFKSLAQCVDCVAECAFHMTAGYVPYPNTHPSFHVHDCRTLMRTCGGVTDAFSPRPTPSATTVPCQMLAWPHLSRPPLTSRRHSRLVERVA